MVPLKAPLTFAEYCEKVGLDPKDPTSTIRYNTYYRRFRGN